MNMYSACTRNYNNFEMAYNDRSTTPIYTEIPQDLSIFDAYRTYNANLPITVPKAHFMDWTTFEGMPNYNLRDATNPTKLYTTNFMYLSAFNPFYGETIKDQVMRIELQYTANKNVLPSYIRHRRTFTLKELELILNPDKYNKGPSFYPEAIERLMTNGGIVEYVCDEPRLHYEDRERFPMIPGANTRAIVAFGAFLPCIIGGLSITELKFDEFNKNKDIEASSREDNSDLYSVNINNCKLLANIISTYESRLEQFGYVDHRNIFKRYDGTEIDAPENLRNAPGYEGIWVIPLTHLNYELLLERLLTPAYYLYSGARPTAEVIDALNTL